MTSGGNNFNIIPENKPIKLANFVHFRRVFMFCLEDWGLGPLPPSLVYATVGYWVKHGFHATRRTQRSQRSERNKPFRST